MIPYNLVPSLKLAYSVANALDCFLEPRFFVVVRFLFSVRSLGAA